MTNGLPIRLMIANYFELILTLLFSELVRTFNFQLERRYYECD